MAASFDQNGDVEINYEPGRRQNPNCLSLLKNNGKMTNLTWILIFVILILAGTIMFLATTMSNLTNGECKTESATFGPFQRITSGPQDTESINVEIQSCGGIINVDMNTTTQIKFRQGFDNYNKISCTWIIKSDAKIINLQWSNKGKLQFPQGELLIGELSLADEELHCRAIESLDDRLTNIVSTPTILHFTSSFHLKSLDVEVKIDPVTNRGTHKSQPQTYYVNKKPAGSLVHHIVRPDSLLGMMTVFENNNDRQLNCSDLNDTTVQCCDLVQAYKIDSAGGSTSCTNIPLSNLATQMYSYRTVVMLAPTHGSCQFNWKKTNRGFSTLFVPTFSQFGVSDMSKPLYG